MYESPTIYPDIKTEGIPKHTILYCEECGWKSDIDEIGIKHECPICHKQGFRWAKGTIQEIERFSKENFLKGY